MQINKIESNTWSACSYCGAIQEHVVILKLSHRGDFYKEIYGENYIELCAECLDKIAEKIRS